MKRRRTQLTIGVMLACATASIARAQGTPIQPAPVTYSIDTMPTGNHVNVAAGADLQQALDNSHPGDELILPAGATYTGSFTLPVRCGVGGAEPAWTIIRSDSTTLPASGTRIDPSVDAAKMPKIVANQNTVPALATHPYDTTQGCYAQKYWIMGVEITPSTSLAFFRGDLVEFGDLNEKDPTRSAKNIYLDRSYVHGLPTAGANGKVTKHGIRLDGKYLAIFSSYLSDFAELLSMGQAQAIYSITGIGPMQITNNYIEGSSENVIFGGNDPGTCSGPSGSAGCTVPSDITFTKNTVKKPLHWKVNDPSHVSGEPSYCNATLFELKNAQRVLIDGNDFQYAWWNTCDASLSGHAITFTVRNQDGGDPAATVQDVTFTNNSVRHVSGGISLLGRDNNSAGSHHTSQGELRFLIQNNLFEDISTNWNDGTNGSSPGRTVFITLPPNWTEYAGAANYPDSVTIDHNTFINNDSNDNSYIDISCDDCYVPPNCNTSGFSPHVTHFTFTNNIVAEVQYGAHGQCTGPDGRDGTNSTFSRYFDATLTFTGNTIVGNNVQSGQSPATWYEGSSGAVGTMNNQRFVGTWNDVGFTNFAGGDYHVPSGSAGADVDVITQHQSGTGGGGCSSVPSADVGAVGIAGSSCRNGNVWTVKGSGADIWGSNDAFQFAYQQLTGDGTIVARVTSVQNTSTYAKAGVMIRQSLDANSPHVVLDLRPSNDVEFMTRPSTGAATTFLATTVQAPPTWLKLERAGSTITASVSANGSTWTTLGTTTLSVTSTVYWGLVVNSHDNAQLNTSMFDNVSMTPASANGNIVIYASDVPASAFHGAWAKTTDATSPNSKTLSTPDNGVSNTTAPLASPTDYVDIRFNAPANTAYTLWFRVKAAANSKLNDSFYVQLSDAQSSGSPVYQLNTTNGLVVNLATDTTGASLNNWGWVDGAYWLSQPATITFASSGDHTIRIQTREDGALIDQIVLSSTQYFNASASCPTTCGSAPGGVTNDSTIVAKPTLSGQPHFDVPFDAPGTFQGEDFDNGGKGVAYHDNVAGNAGGQYRTSEDVDILAATGNASGYVVYNFETGEWLNYTFAAASAGTYSVSLNVSSEFSGTTFHLEVDGVDVSGTVTVPNTGSWSTFQPVTVNGVVLSSGTHVLKVVTDLQYFNFDSVQIQ